MRQVVYTMFISNNLSSFQLWWQENLFKHPNMWKRYQIDCLKNFLLLIKFLLTTNFVKNSDVWPRIFFIFLKTVLNHTWNAFKAKFRHQWKNRKSIYLLREDFSLISNLSALTLVWDSVKSLRITKILEEINFEWVCDESESKSAFQRQSVTRYLRLTLVSMWKSRQCEKFNRCFSGLFG